MKYLWKTLLLSLVLPALCLAADNIEAPAECKHCGMNRTKFAYSRMQVTYTDGSNSGVCSINCAITDYAASKGKKVKTWKVGEYNSKMLIDAKSAVWTVGGKKKGVMTPVAKWAFADNKGAEEYIRENGGKVATFDEVKKLTEKELEEAEHHHGHEHGKHGNHKK